MEDHADEQERKRSQVNLGAIYQTAILQGWGAEQKAGFEAEAKRQDQKQQAAQAREVEKEREARAEQSRASVRKSAKERFDTLDPEVQARLMRQFGETLKRFPLAIFSKSGVSSAILAPTFAMWLAEQFASQDTCDPLRMLATPVEPRQNEREKAFLNGRVVAGEASWLWRRWKETAYNP